MENISLAWILSIILIFVALYYTDVIDEKFDKVGQFGIYLIILAIFELTKNIFPFR